MNLSLPRDYSLIAPVYDQIFNKILSQGHYEIGQLLKYKSKNKKLNVLEVGIGSGLTLDYLPHKISYTGVDINKQMLHLAKKKITNTSSPNVTLTLMDAQKLKFKTNTFNFVIAASVITAVHDPKKTIEEMIRVTKKNGYIVIVANIRNKKSIRSQLIKQLDPITKKILGFRTDLESDYFDNFKNLKLLREAPINTFMGLPLSSFLLLQKN